MMQLPDPPPPTPKPAGAFTIRSRVNLVSVPVVVRDSKGRAVGSLSRGDFRIADNGKQQTITKFSIEKFGEAAPEVIAAATAAKPVAPAAPPVPQRFVAFFFDDLNMSVSDLVNVRAAAWRYMQNSIRPTERVAIATASGETSLEFTDDLEKLHQTLLAIRPHPGVVQSAVDCPPMSVFQADRIVNANDGTALGAAVADYRACAQPSGSDAETVFTVTNFARMQVNLAERALLRALGALDGLFRKMGVMAGQRTVVMASPGFQILDSRRQDELFLFDRALHSGIVVNALNARGLFAMVPGGDASERTVSADGVVLGGYIGGVAGQGGGTSQAGAPTAVTRMSFTNQELLAQRATLAEIASATGGRFFENSNDLDAGISRLASAPEYLYVLGFDPDDLKLDGKYHSLKVTLRNGAGLTIEARKGYYAPRSETDPGERAKQEISEAFFSRDETNDIGLRVQTSFVKTSGANAKLSVITKVDLKQISFRKEKQSNRNDLTLVTGIFDSNGNYVSGIQKVLEMRLSDETLQSLQKSGASVDNTFDLGPGTYLLRLVLHDEGGQSMASRNVTVVIP